MVGVQPVKLFVREEFRQDRVAIERNEGQCLKSKEYITRLIKHLGSFDDSDGTVISRERLVLAENNVVVFEANAVFVLTVDAGLNRDHDILSELVVAVERVVRQALRTFVDARDISETVSRAAFVVKSVPPHDGTSDGIERCTARAVQKGSDARAI